MAAAKKAKNQGTGRDARRVSFAKISDTLTVPDLLSLQTESFDWLIGANAGDALSGLTEIFEEISPIENDTMQLSFTNPYLEEKKYELDECKELCGGKTDSAGTSGDDGDFARHALGEVDLFDTHVFLLTGWGRLVGGDENVFFFGEVQGCVGAEFASQAGLLETTEGGVEPYR